jgi:succinate dehydrogenase subunit C
VTDLPGTSTQALAQAPSEVQARSVRAAAWRFLLQRTTAAALALCVVVHLVTIIYAVRQGLSAEAIVARIRANSAWPVFYAVFVVAAAIHAPLGLRAIADEWLRLRGRGIDVALGVFALGLLAGGLYAVQALVR